MERRLFSARGLQFRTTSDGMLAEGYAATYGQLSRDLGGFRERLKRGAFDAVLRSKPDVVATLNHNNDLVLGRTTSGTLRLRGDSRGLAFSLDLPDTAAGHDTYELLKRGDVDSCSFAFSGVQRSIDDDWTEEDLEDELDLMEPNHPRESRGRVVVRTIKSIPALHDIALCSNNASYPGTKVDARELELVGAETRSFANAFASHILPDQELIPVCHLGRGTYDLFSRGFVNKMKRAVADLREQVAERDHDNDVRRRRKNLLDLILS